MQAQVITNKADADAKNVATNERVTTEVTRLDDKNVQQDNLIAANKADADAKNVAINERVTTEVTRLDDKNVQQDNIINAHTTIINNVLGGNANTVASGTTTLGNNANGNNTNGSTIVGNNATATKDNSTVVGNGATSNGMGGIAIGKDALADNNGAIAVGHKSTARGEDAIALGKGAVTTGNNSVAIGAGSTAQRDNVVSVGAKGEERTIINVAEGFQATDAVNVRQLRREITRLDAMDNLQNETLTRHDNALQSLGYQMNNLEHSMSAGIAGAVALSSIPAAQVGKHAVGFGTGHFNGEDAVSVGYTGSLMTDSSNVISIKVGAAFSKGGNNTFGMGATYNFN